jgi:imidazole glycerol-phosphate synthase subunit HisF
MTLTRRIVVCLDVHAGRVVKGTRFVDLRDIGDPVQVAQLAEGQGADEIVFLDVSATAEERDALLDAVERTASSVFVPLTVGGGIRSVRDVGAMLRAGADKVSINSAAVTSPELLTECADRFGSQCVVASIDASRVPSARSGQADDASLWLARTRGGRQATTLDAVEWANRCAQLGAGEILLTSIDRDGTRQGYDLELITAVSRLVSVPVVASGGGGTSKHLADAFSAGADAALVAGIIHDGSATVDGLKRDLASLGIPVRVTDARAA